MWWSLGFNKKAFVKKVASDIAQETSKELTFMHQSSLQEIHSTLKLILEKVHSLEERLDSKEVRDKQNYGHLHYKIHELQNDLGEKE